MRLVIDESVGYPIIERLRQDGHEILAIEDLAPAADDTIVLDIAAREASILLTEDKDFGDLVYQHHLPIGPGIILLRLEGMTTLEKCERVASILRARAAEFGGAFTVIMPNSVRIRTLPQ